MAAAANIDPIQLYLPSESLYIFTDIETDSVQANILLQIAAVTEKGEEFNVFINPRCPLTQSCTTFLGFYFFNGGLYRNGRKLPSIFVAQALENFMKWISKLKQPVVLVFHNGFSFDCTILARFLVQFGIKIPENLITVGDTLPYIRNTLKAPLVENHKLGTLAKYFQIDQEQAHDALSDSLTLKLICDKLADQNGTGYQQIFKDSFRPFSDYLNKHLLGTPIVPLKKKNKEMKKVTAT